MICSLFLLSSCITVLATISSRINETSETKTTTEAKEEGYKTELFSWAKDSLGSDLYAFCLNHRASESSTIVSSGWKDHIGEIDFTVKATDAENMYFLTLYYDYDDKESYYSYYTYSTITYEGFTSQPCYLVFSCDNVNDLIIVDVSSKKSYTGSFTVSVELAQFIMKCPSSSNIKVYAYDEYKDRLYNSYSGTRDLYFEIQAGDIQKLITVYQVLYAEFNNTTSNTNLANKEVFSVSNSCDYLYMDWSDNLRLEYADDISIQLQYKKCVNSSLYVGLRREPSKLLIKRTSTDESVVVEVDNSGVLKLNDNLIKFIYESPAGSKLKVEYYDSNEYRISWYSLDSAGTEIENSNYYSTINVNSAKKLIDFYCTYKNPLDCWEINKEYTTNWILGLD